MEEFLEVPAELHNDLGARLHGRDAAESLLTLAYLMAQCLSQLTDNKYSEDGIDEAVFVLKYMYRHVCNNPNTPTH